MKYILLGILISFLSVGASAAGVSHTTFSGNAYSNSFSVGGSNAVTSYIGGHVAVETSQDVFSVSKGLYVGTDINSSNYHERSNSQTSFEGTSSSNGLVGRTEQTSNTTEHTVGRSNSYASGSRHGHEFELSIVGSYGNGAIGGEYSTYSNSYNDSTRSRYGSNVYSQTYSTNSYNLD